MSYIEVILQVIQFKMVHLQHPWKNTIQWVLQQQLTAKPPVLPNTWIGSLKTKVAIIKKLANWFAEQIHWLFFIWRQLSCLMSWKSFRKNFLPLSQTITSLMKICFDTNVFSPNSSHFILNKEKDFHILKVFPGWKHFSKRKKVLR